jgi:hypothetical protein
MCTIAQLMWETLSCVCIIMVLILDFVKICLRQCQVKIVVIPQAKKNM